MDLEVEFSFSAAHRLPYYDGPCFRMHGHNYKLQVVITGKPDPRTGMILDFEDIRRIVEKELLAKVDHQTLNDVLENPTAENLVVWAWQRLKSELPGLRELRLWENAVSSVVYRGD